MVFGRTYLSTSIERPWPRMIRALLAVPLASDTVDEGVAWATSVGTAISAVFNPCLGSGSRAATGLLSSMPRS